MASLKVTLSLPILAKMIDHSLLRPTMTDVIIEDGLEIPRQHRVATACIRPYSSLITKKYLAGADVRICAVMGFPHGNCSIAVKVFEACKAIGADHYDEIDMVVNIGRVLGHDWGYVRDEISYIYEAVTIKHGTLLKVVFENEYLSEIEIIELCRICNDIGNAFVKTNTGYGFVKQTEGNHNYTGAMHDHLRLMRKEAGSAMQIKAAGV